MTAPRQHIPGQAVLITRRTSERRYFLRPDNFLDQVLPYEVGKASSRHDQKIYAAVAMSNHIHFCIGDPNGDRSKFMQDAMSGIARVTNRHLERSGHFWDARRYGDTVLLDVNALERKLLYIWLNPVHAGLVERAEDWPGFMILPRHWGTKITIEKPDRFYGRQSPEKVAFIPSPPPGYEHLSLHEVRTHFEDLLRRAEDKIAADRKSENLTIEGIDKILALVPTSSPCTPSPLGAISPRFASLDTALLTRAYESYANFLETYQVRRQRWLKGSKAKKTVFPCGTVWLRRCAPVICEPPCSRDPGLLLNQSSHK